MYFIKNKTPLLIIEDHHEVIQKTCYCFEFIFALVLPASSQEELTTQGILATAKMAGACGILDSMINFQKTTKMEGGNAFVLRFWEVESARLGMTVEQLSNQCNQAVTGYDKLWNTTESQ